MNTAGQRIVEQQTIISNLEAEVKRLTAEVARTSPSLSAREAEKEQSQAKEREAAIQEKELQLNLREQEIKRREAELSEHMAKLERLRDEHQERARRPRRNCCRRKWLRAPTPRQKDVPQLPPPAVAATQKIAADGAWYSTSSTTMRSSC